MNHLRFITTSLKTTALTSALILSGCAEHCIREAESMTPTGSEFNKNLHKEYVSFADQEGRGMPDPVSGHDYAMKAVQAGKGEMVLPTDVKTVKLPQDVQAEAEKGRANLIAALDNGGRDKHPAVAASAQSKFDCWIEQSVEGWQLDHIKSCKDGFYGDLEKLDGKDHGMGDIDFKIMFTLNSSHLSKDAHHDVQKAAERAKEHKDTNLVVIGMADKVGSDKHNMKLSKSRAENVKKALHNHGVELKRLKVEAKGEVGTLEVDPTQRRVDIFFQ